MQDFCYLQNDCIHIIKQKKGEKMKKFQLLEIPSQK